MRTEFGKRIRKQYEAGKFDISRHDFMQYEMRTDGIANTVSTVTKDNLLAMIKVKNSTKQGYAEIRLGGGDEHSVSRQRHKKGACD